MMRVNKEFLDKLIVGIPEEISNRGLRFFNYRDGQGIHPIREVSYEIVEVKSEITFTGNLYLLHFDLRRISDGSPHRMSVCLNVLNDCFSDRNGIFLQFIPPVFERSLSTTVSFTYHPMFPG